MTPDSAMAQFDAKNAELTAIVKRRLQQDARHAFPDMTLLGTTPSSAFQARSTRAERVSTRRSKRLCGGGPSHHQTG